MTLVAGYLLSYVNARAIMYKLGIPDKGVADIMLKSPINNWLAKTKRHPIVSNTVGNIYSGYKEAEGVLLITHIKVVRRGQSQDVDLLSERGKEEHVKQ
jgi:hypothetical protein